MPTLRTLPGRTIGTLQQELREASGVTTTNDVPTDTIQFHLTTETPEITWRGGAAPATEDSLVAFTSQLRVTAPQVKWMRETDPALCEILLNGLLAHVESSALQVTAGDRGVVRVLKPGKVVVDPVDVVGITGRVLGSMDSEVTLLVDDTERFRFDVRVPETHDRGVGGDLPTATNQIGDITTGGVTVELDRKRNLAPSVQPYFYRLWCTNGASHRDPGLRLDARGQSVEEVLAEFEALADRAFSRVEDQISAFYDLRNQRVENPERALAAIAREQGIRDRSLVGLVQLAASDELPDEPTMFDIVNLVTNYANQAPNLGGRNILEGAGGAVINDHAARCGHCQTRLRD